MSFNTKLYASLSQDVRKARDELDKRQQKISATVKYKPDKRVCDENAALVKCQVNETLT